MDDGFKTPARDGYAELEIKRSRFIAHCSRALTEKQAADYIASVKAGYKDASSNVYAYYLRNNLLSRCTDDGEPSGTAGVPVLETLTKREIYDAAVVVTRYYGGTKLGTGGLVRAYSGAASAALENAGIAVMTRCARFSLTVEYPLYEQAARLIENGGGAVDGAAFAERVTLDVTIPRALLEPLKKELTELLRGQPELLKLREEFLPLGVLKQPDARA